MRLHLVVLPHDLLTTLLVSAEALDCGATHIPCAHILEQRIQRAEEPLAHGHGAVDLPCPLHCMVECITNSTFAVMPCIL